MVDQHGLLFEPQPPALLAELGHDASADGVNQTPYFIVKGPRGEKHVDTLEGFNAAIAAVGPPAS